MTPYVLENVADYGSDISFVRNLRATITGDLKTINGIELVVQSRIRELTTPFGYLARFIQDRDGIKLVDADYGNSIFNLLAEPSNTLPFEKVAEECRRIMLKDSRIASTEVKPFFDDEQNVLRVQIDFTLADGNQGQIGFDLGT